MEKSGSNAMRKVFVAVCGGEKGEKGKEKSFKE